MWPSISYQTDSLENSPYWALIQSFSDKIQKLNQGHYAKLNQYDLFVHSELFIWPGEETLQLSRLLQEMISRNNRSKHFTFVYLLGIEKLSIWNLKSGVYKMTEVNSDDYLQFGLAARELVIQKEEM